MLLQFSKKGGGGPGKYDHDLRYIYIYICYCFRIATYETLVLSYFNVLGPILLIMLSIKFCNYGMDADNTLRGMIRDNSFPRPGISVSDSLTWVLHNPQGSSTFCCWLDRHDSSLTKQCVKNICICIGQCVWAKISLTSFYQIFYVKLFEGFGIWSLESLKKHQSQKLYQPSPTTTQCKILNMIIILS